MKVTYISKSDRKLTFKVVLDKGEEKKGIGQGGRDIELIGDRFSFIFPCSVEKIHPDLIALSVLTVVYPWIKKKISFPEDVSNDFAVSVKDNCSFCVVGIDKELSKRGFGNRDAVSFSGGVDSVAVTQIVPEDAINLMFLRRKHKDIKDIQPEYSIEAQKEITAKFKNTYFVESDLEHITGPFPQYPTWTALSTPCFLMADHFSLKSVNYGTIVGSANIKEGKKFKVIEKPDAMWSALYNVVGLHLSKPVAGITEIGTSIIVHKSNLDNIATSCQFGSMNHPCMKCFKCFRKYLMETAVKKKDISNNIIDSFLRQKSIQNYIVGEPPLYFQHIFMYSLSRIEVDNSLHPVMRLFKEKVLLMNDKIEWYDKHYKIATNYFIPDKKLRKVVLENIDKFIHTMSKEDAKVFESWNLHRDYSLEYSQKKLERIDFVLKYIFNKINYDIKIENEVKNIRLKIQSMQESKFWKLRDKYLQLTSYIGKK